MFGSVSLAQQIRVPNSPRGFPPVPSPNVSSGPAVPLADIVQYLDGYLRVREVPDERNAVNGLQVENQGMRVLRERTSLVFAANTARRARQDWDEHSKILEAVIDGDEDLAAMLATRHVHRAADAAFAPQGTRSKSSDRKSVV